MDTTKAFRRAIIVGGILGVVLVVVLYFGQSLCQEQQQQMFTSINYIYLGLFVVVTVVFLLSYIFKQLNIWSLALTSAFIIYSGLQLFGISFYKDTLIKWNPTLLGLGLSFVVFGWSFYQQYSQNQNTKQYYESLQRSISRLNSKINTLDKSWRSNKRRTKLIRKSK